MDFKRHLADISGLKNQILCFLMANDNLSCKKGVIIMKRVAAKFKYSNTVKVSPHSIPLNFNLPLFTSLIWRSDSSCSFDRFLLLFSSSETLFSPSFIYICILNGLQQQLLGFFSVPRLSSSAIV